MTSRAWKIVIGLTALGLLAGCVEKKVYWSPDGRWAALIGADGLHLSDAEGKLTKPILAPVSRVAWFPDSRRLLAVTATTAQQWEEVTAVLEPGRLEIVTAVAEKLRDEMLAYQGEWDKFEPDPKIVEPITPGELCAAAMYLGRFRLEGLRDRLGEEWDKWKSELEKLTPAIYHLRIVDVDGGDGRLGAVVFSSIDDIASPVISPDGGLVAFVSSTTALVDATRRVGVMELRPEATPQWFDDNVANNCAWSADGRFVLYAKANQPAQKDHDTVRLGTIARKEVSDDRGKLRDVHAGDAEQLAGILFDDKTTVRGLRDGGIIFSASEVSLPCTTKDMPQRVTLFALNPDKQSTITRLIPREAEERVGDAVFLFEVSPDENYVSLPGGNGRITVLKLATGELTEVRPEQEDNKLRTVPVWRTARELCFASGTGSEWASANRAEMVLYDVGARKARTISRDWPNEAVDFLMPDQKDEKQDAGAAEQEQLKAQSGEAPAGGK